MMILLTEICNDLKNYFPPSSKRADLSYIYRGNFTISDSSIAPLDFIKPNQYFRIVGSDMNEGVWQNNPENLKELIDEEFDGAIWAMAVPRDFIALCEEIRKFNAKIDEMALIEKGYASESWGGYSYSLSSSAPAAMAEWQKRISRKLNMYRKIGVF